LQAKVFVVQSPHDPELARRLHKQAYSRSAVNISSVANGAFGEHRRQDNDGMSPEIAPPGC
jgi:hypothetical protein